MESEWIQLESRHTVASSTMKRALRNILEAPLYLKLMLVLAVLMLNVLVALLLGFNYLFDTILKQVNKNDTHQKKKYERSK